MTSSPNRKVDRIIAAFQGEKPSFEVDRDSDVFEFEGRVGVRARNLAACIHVDGREVKKAYYVEGNPYQMGYLLGWMAEPDVARMCTEFLERVVHEGTRIARFSSNLLMFFGRLVVGFGRRLLPTLKGGTGLPTAQSQAKGGMDDGRAWSEESFHQRSSHGG